MTDTKVIDKYLANYACAEASQALGCIAQEKYYQFSIGIPAFDEPPEFIESVLPACRAATLVILVVNQPEGSASNTNNRAVISAIAERGRALASFNNLTLYRLTGHIDLLLVDKASAGNQISRHQGVGLARKIAADIALALYAREQLASQWLCATDADAELPASYFDTVRALPEAAACIFPFYHRADKDADAQTIQFTQLYENKIRAYVRGLDFAGSPYAYHSIGSTICVNAWHYAAVRGYPPRSAGEDFYLLNKLRKTGAVITLAAPAIALRVRRSMRTPFGTGASVDKLAGACDPAATIFYHPALFACLRALLVALDKLAGQCGLEPEQSAAGNWKEKLFVLLKQGDLRVELKSLCGEQIAWEPVFAAILVALEKIGFARALAHCDSHAHNPAQYRRHLHNWFDAFRSMRWLHELRASVSAFANLSEDRNIDMWSKLAELRAGPQQGCG